MESWCGHDGLAAECAQDPEDGCGSVTRVEQVAKSFALASNAKYDPLFAAKVPLVQEYATQIWDGRISPGTLVRAHKAWLQRRSSKPTWHGVHGPLGAVIMSLRRIGWSFENGSCATQRHRDVWRHWLSVGSRDGAARSLAFDPSEASDIWLRHMRYMMYPPKGLGLPAKVNMYFSMVTGGLI